MKILITGGQGDIALAIKKAIEAKYPDWLVYNPSKSELDVANEDSVERYFSSKEIDILINNAGVIYPDVVKSSDIGSWLKTINVNLIGTYLTTRFALEKGCQKIISIASTSGLKGRAGWSSYCASKAGVISFTESLVEEGIDAHCLVARRTDTKMRNQLFPNEDKSSLDTPESVANQIIELL